MAGALGRNLHLCFTKIKRPLDPHHHFNNFNSLYDFNFDSTSDSPPHPRLSSSDDDEPDFTTIFASQRFFFSSPGRSNSIVESAEPSDTPVRQKYNATPLSDTNTIKQSSESCASPTVKDSVAVPRNSPDPYLDFRQSMQEMVQGRGIVDVKADWDYLHELLLCYLALNPKSTHKFIVRAFADLIVTLLASPPPAERE